MNTRGGLDPSINVMMNQTSNPVPDPSAGFSHPAGSGIAALPLRLADADLPEIAVGVLSYNRAEEVIRTLELLDATDYPAAKLHLVVIDNASSDGTAARVLAQFGRRVEVVTLGRNVGAIARNHILLRRRERYLFQFDDDCAPLGPGMIRRAVELFEANPGIGALCFRSVNLHTGQTEFGDLGVLSRRRLHNGGYECIAVVGGGMAFRGSEVQRTTGYDERVFWGGEELQLGLEFLYHGVRIVYHPGLALIHRQAPRGFTRAQQLEIDMRNNVLIGFTFYPVPLALAVTLMRLVRHGLAAVIKPKPGGVAAIFRGVGRGLLLTPGALAARRTIPISRLAEHSRWFFASFVSMPPSSSDEPLDPELLRRAVQPGPRRAAALLPDSMPVS